MPNPGEAIPIKNDILAVYTRYYSEIPPLQHAGCAEYVLCRVEGTLCLLVRAQHAGEERARAARCELCGAREDTARQVLRFLYENAVSVENICDVVQDIAFAGAKGETE